MSTWARICCAVDFSDGARAALDQATLLARQYGAELVLVHVFQPPTLSLMAEPLFPSPGVLNELERALADELERWRLRAVASGVARVTSEVLIAPGTAQGLIDYAAKHACDVIVIGTHGRSGIKRLLLGSVAEHVVRHASVPVVVVRAGAGEASAA